MKAYFTYDYKKWWLVDMIDKPITDSQRYSLPMKMLIQISACIREDGVIIKARDPEMVPADVRVLKDSPKARLVYERLTGTAMLLCTGFVEVSEYGERINSHYW